LNARLQGLPEFWVGAVLGDRFTIVKHIEAGGYGRGWVAVDGSTGSRVFLKTFRSGGLLPPPTYTPHTRSTHAHRVGVGVLFFGAPHGG
jgi:hypothetical protein